MKADLSELFSLSEAFSKNALRAKFADFDPPIEDWSSGNCDQPIKLVRHSGSKFNDLVGTTYSGFYLLSQHVEDALLQNGVSGWRMCPIELSLPDKPPNTSYGAMGIHARCGPLDNSRSPMVTRIFPNTKTSQKCYLGLYFEENSWTGDDIFRPEGTMLTIVTRRVKDLLLDIGASNIEFRPILSIERYML